MQFNTFLKQKLPFFVALGLTAVLTSCGSFQYAGYDNDGIYSSEEYNYNTEVEEPVATTSTNDSNYYKNYFAENSAEIDAINQDGEIFTDIDGYEGNYTEQDSTQQRVAYGGWGQNNSSVTINYIDNGWYGGWYGWNDPWLWNGSYAWGWGRPWGWNNWRWNYGWGWNDPWLYGGYYGYGWNNWGYYGGFYNYGWNNPYYRGYNRYAYSAGRRGSLLYNNNLSRNTRSNAAVSRRDYSTSRLSNSSRLSRSSNSRSVRSSSSTMRRSSSSTSRSSRVTRPATSRSSRSSTMRSGGSTRSSGSVRSSSSRSSSRSSGSVRSSGGSRSSGSSSRGGSSGGSRRGGRG